MAKMSCAKNGCETQQDASSAAGAPVSVGAVPPTYPTVRWIRTRLRYDLVHPVRRKILGATIVGSEARGVARPGSDLDVAVVIPRVRGKSSLQITDDHHARYMSNNLKPEWNGRVVDVQFFYPDDPELARYDKIELKEK
jgi:predicted nucleotidyltransferase